MRPLTPSVTSSLIADQVFQQAGGKWCVIGVFDRVFSSRFPVHMHSLGIFVVLSGASGDYDVKVEFCNSKDQLIGAFEGIRIESVSSRLVPVYLGFQTYQLPIPSAGRYFFKLFFNGQQAVSEITLDAELLEAKQ